MQGCRSFPVLCNIFLFLLLTPFGAGQDGSKINIVAAPCRLWGNSTAENLARDVGGSASTVTAADGDKVGARTWHAVQHAEQHLHAPAFLLWGIIQAQPLPA